MSKTYKEIIEVEISNIVVDNELFSFDYKVLRNENIVKDGHYVDVYHLYNKKEMEVLLNNGYAVTIILKTIYT